MNRRRFLSSVAALGAWASAQAIGSERRLRVAVIGHTGRGGYGHGLDTAWLTSPEVELVAVADADAQGLASAQSKLRVTRGYADYREMLREAQPEIVAVAPRFVDEHRDMALAAIGAGARGLYIEKPFCRSLAECDEIIAAAESRNVKIAIAHRNRYHPTLAAIDRIIEYGTIGRLLEIRGRGKEDSRGGPLDLWVLGSHVLNLTAYFGGTPRACSATVLHEGHPVVAKDLNEGAEGVGLLGGNEVHARFEMQRGVTAYFDSVQNAAERPYNFGLQLIGTQGLINLCLDKAPLAHLVRGKPFEPSSQPREWIPVSSAGPGEPEPVADIAAQVGGHLLTVRDLVSAIRENRQPLCSGYDGRTTVEMIAAVFESHRLQGQRVTFPLATRQHPFSLL